MYYYSSNSRLFFLLFFWLDYDSVSLPKRGLIFSATDERKKENNTTDEKICR